jgi:uncharacterized glyoxalase superfamily protein PhnB
MTSTTPSSAQTVDLVSVRIITADVAGMVTFYEAVTARPARWATPAFAELVTPGGTLAIADVSTVALFGADIAEPARNRTAIVEFRVADVDAEHARLAGVGELVQAPTTMPWGNRSLLLRDPDGNLVNLFTPVTDEALRRLEG